LEDLGVEGRIILKRIFHKWVGESCTEDREVSWEPVNEVMNLRLS